MFRVVSQVLADWIGHPTRKPLVIRGARQVGKTWLVRELARDGGRDLVELNFERTPQEERFFASNDPKRIINEIALARGRRLTPEQSLLFLDEVQAAPDLLAKLRWFAEELPELPVIAAGSLLEFALAKPELSMPVGRVSYLTVAPMSFAEFLDARGQRLLVEHLTEWSPGTNLSAAAHAKATEWYQRFAMVGGMPAIVAAAAAGCSARDVRQLQSDFTTGIEKEGARARLTSCSLRVAASYLSSSSPAPPAP